MEQTEHTQTSLSPRRIIGFACNQGFVFFLFYMGLNRSLNIGSYTIERIDLIGTLIFMALSLLILFLIPQSARKALFVRPLLLLYALMIAAGSLIPYFITELTAFWFLLESILVGVACALLLAAWGRTFGEVSTKVATTEVFFASLLAGVFGLIISIIPISRADLIFRFLPFVSAAALMVSMKSNYSFLTTPIVDDSSREAMLLSVKIMAGTGLFGMAAGFMETFNTDPGMPAMPTHAVAFILFAAFALGTVSILVSDGFGKGSALNKAYRLAVFIMLMGFLLIPAPFLAGSSISGEAIYLAGYLGLNAVLISLFLVVANITGTSTIASFSRGFISLFVGELIGVTLANLINSTQIDFVTPYDVVVLASILVLLSYIFLFTERDFDSLSEIFTDADSFEDRCRELVERYKLSNREAEILPYILKGRTSERISQELFISKSTVDTHVRRIYSKMDVHNRQELIDLSEQSSA